MTKNSPSDVLFNFAHDLKTQISSQNEIPALGSKYRMSQKIIAFVMYYFYIDIFREGIQKKYTNKDIVLIYFDLLP